jgi:hypothetical protein
MLFCKKYLSINAARKKSESTCPSISDPSMAAVPPDAYHLVIANHITAADILLEIQEGRVISGGNMFRIIFTAYIKDWGSIGTVSPESLFMADTAISPIDSL